MEGIKSPSYLSYPTTKFWASKVATIQKSLVILILGMVANLLILWNEVWSLAFIFIYPDLIIYMVNYTLLFNFLFIYKTLFKTKFHILAYDILVDSELNTGLTRDEQRPVFIGVLRPDKRSQIWKSQNPGIFWDSDHWSTFCRPTPHPTPELRYLLASLG